MYAGLPLQAAFTEALLAPRSMASHPMRPLVAHLSGFVHDAFNHNRRAKAPYWPNLEDLFTNIDLAANTGHHLGRDHSPSNLRTMRRALLARMMYMLNERYLDAERNESAKWKKLDKFFGALDIERDAFISINWDTVIERRLADRRRVQNFDYRCGALAAEFAAEGDIVSARTELEESVKVPVIKIHGSVNWLYCDNCRQLYWFPPDDAIQVAMQLITPQEAKALKLQDAHDCGRWFCVNCETVPLPTRASAILPANSDCWRNS